MPLLLGSLRGKFVFWLAVVFSLSLVISAIAFHRVSDFIISALGERFAEKQALYDRARIKAPLQKEVLMARRLSESEALRAWMKNEKDASLKAAAFRELEGFRSYFYDGSYSLIVHQTGDYYYNNRMGDYDGKELIYSVNAHQPDDAWYFQEMKMDMAYLLHVGKDTHLNTTKLWVDVPIFDGQHKPLGMVRAGIPIGDFIDAFIGDREQGITNIIINADGVIEAHPDVSLIDTNTYSTSTPARFTFFNLMNSEEDRAEFQAALDALKMVPTQVQILPLVLQGETRLVGVAYMPDLGWFNITVMDIPTLLSGFSLTPILIVLFCVLVFSLLAVAAVLQYFVLSRLTYFDKAARSVSSGRYDIQLKTVVNDELGRLALGFNQMAKTIRTNTEKLEQRVAERTKELQHANILLEQKNKQIIDSIRYARLIQNAILPRSDIMARYLEQHFVVWIPRDVVGGDFYFLHPVKDSQSYFIGLVDCTGHGIPGAFMTMTAHAVIRQVLSDSSELDLSDILMLIDERLRKTLQHSGEHQGMDYGMDIALCRIHDSQLEYAGCGIDLCVLSQENVSILKAARRGLGYQRKARQNKPLLVSQIPLSQATAFYLVSDGLLDQDGGEDGFGFGRERFLQQVAAWRHIPVNEQQQKWAELLATYQGDRVQRDDITILGFTTKQAIWWEEV